MSTLIHTRETTISIHSDKGAVQGREKGRAPPVKILPPPVDCGLPMKFMIKHNLPLVRGGSLWQYRSVPPAAIMATPCPPNVNRRTATALINLPNQNCPIYTTVLIVRIIEKNNQRGTCTVTIKVKLSDFEATYQKTSTTALSNTSAVVVPLLTINGWILMMRKVAGGSTVDY